MPPAQQSNRAPSRLLTRCFNPDKHLDYVWLTIFAALPAVIAMPIGVFDTVDGFIGYGDRYNWMLLIPLLPLAAYALRWTAKRIGPFHRVHMTSAPPVVALIKTDAARVLGYRALRSALLASNNLYAALLITLVIHVADMHNLARFYLSDAVTVCPTATCVQESTVKQRQVLTLERPAGGTAFTVEKDWSIAYLNPNTSINKGSNLAMVVSAYAVQFAIVFIGMLLIIIILRHNLFFLSHIYQRRRVTPGEEALRIQIDLDDPDKCFGFRPANDAFNVQVLTLTMAAFFILGTRFTNVGPGTGLFPDIGQWLCTFGWLAALAMVSLPILIKLLPRLPCPGPERAPASLVNYLREFLPDETWLSNRETSAAEVQAVAAKFAENAFWPTGNNRAWQLYFLSFWVFFIALVPNPRALVETLPDWSMYVSWAISGVLAWGTTWSLFFFLRMMLTYIDSRLVDLPTHTHDATAIPRRRKITIGLFISYRREDTSAYTGRLYDSLSADLDREKIFMDLDTIPGGVDFFEAIKNAIDSAQAMIVVIGPKWMTAENSDGSKRIQDPNDFVHQEVALGLQRGIRLFPVLVGGARMPAENDLPDALKALAARNACEISDARWASDVQRLLNDLKTLPAGP